MLIQAAVVRAGQWGEQNYFRPVSGVGDLLSTKVCLTSMTVTGTQAASPKHTSPSAQGNVICVFALLTECLSGPGSSRLTVTEKN